MNDAPASHSSPELLKDIQDATKQISDKAGLMRELHIFSLKKCKIWINSLLIITILSTISISFLSLAVPMIFSLNEKGQSILGVLITFVGFLVLIISVSDRIFGFNERCAAHTQGVHLLSTLITDCTRFRDVESKANDFGKNCLCLKALQDRYSEINQSLPINDLSDVEFLQVKKKFKLKVAVSTRLGKDQSFDIYAALGYSRIEKILKSHYFQLILVVIVIILLFLTYKLGYDMGYSQHILN
jgi:hypothetical protein